jgi:hypothetical protein
MKEISLDTSRPCIQSIPLPFVSSNRCLWLRSSKLDGVVAEIVDGVPFSEESVAEDGKWATC